MRNCIKFFGVVTFAIIALSAFANDFEVDGLYFNKNKDGISVTLVAKPYGYYTKSPYDNSDHTYIPNDLIIPAEITYEDDTYAVTAIEAWAFRKTYGLRSVTIPNSVTMIGRGAFDDCQSLENINFPESLASIGKDALSGTEWFNNQPDGIVYAGTIAYKYKGNMPSNTSLTLKEGTTRIAEECFKSCGNLESVTFPKSLEVIEDRAFWGCSKLKKDITFPESLISIGESAFYDCKSLTSVTFPESIVSIGPEAFRGCNLKKITFPNSIAEIGRRAFSQTPWFEKQPDGLVYIGNVAYEYKGNMPSDTFITLKEGTVAIVDGCFSNYDGSSVNSDRVDRLKGITLPESLISIGKSAFSYNYSLTSVTIPNSVTKIGWEAFYKCTGLTNVIFGDSVVEIGGEAFYGCGLTSVVLPKALTIIDRQTFADCYKLTSVTIPNSVTEIGYGAFSACDLTSLTIPSSVIEIDGVAFYGNRRLTSVVIPESVTMIGDCAFKKCTSLNHVVVMNPNAKIDYSAFEDTPQGMMIERQRELNRIKEREQYTADKIKESTAALPALKQKIGTTTFNNLNSGIITNGMKWSSIMAFRDYINKWNFANGATIVDYLPKEVKIGGIRVKSTSSTAYGTNYAIDFTNRRGRTVSGGFIRVKNGTVTSVNLDRGQ